MGLQQVLCFCCGQIQRSVHHLYGGFDTLKENVTKNIFNGALSVIPISQKRQKNVTKVTQNRSQNCDQSVMKLP